MNRRLVPTLTLLLLLAACGGGTDTATHVEAVETVSPNAISEILSSDEHVILDIRTPDEFAGPRLEGAVNIDFYEPTFASEIAALDPDASYVVYCRSGSRSGQAMDLIRDLGFSDVHEIDGGIVAWAEAGLPVVGP
jgi:rhodanese-related sulfurtransferase